MLKKWKDNEDPFTNVTLPDDNDEDEEEIPIEEEDEEEEEIVPESHFRVTESTGSSDTVEIKHSHPHYEEIFQLLREEGGD